MAMAGKPRGRLAALNKANACPSGKNMRAKQIVPFEDRVLSMARSLVEYQYYGNEEKNAAKILHRHHPELALSACTRAFSAYARAYEEAIAFVDANSKAHWDEYVAREQGTNQDSIQGEQEFIDKHPEVPKDIQETMFLWIFNWHHMR
jgi:hypothetical protein